MVKPSGGAVGLTENPSAFKRWLFVGPEQVRLMEEFENQIEAPATKDSSSYSKHHKEGMSPQRQLLEQTQQLIKTIRTYGNLFEVDCD